VFLVLAEALERTRQQVRYYLQMVDLQQLWISFYSYVVDYDNDAYNANRGHPSNEAICIRVQAEAMNRCLY
jgi:hypothetical protein